MPVSLASRCGTARSSGRTSIGTRHPVRDPEPRPDAFGVLPVAVPPLVRQLRDEVQAPAAFLIGTGRAELGEFVSIGSVTSRSRTPARTERLISIRANVTRQ